jgi:hypothetical protein
MHDVRQRDYAAPPDVDSVGLDTHAPDTVAVAIRVIL